MNPFNIPEKIYISRYPQDMRAGIPRLSCLIAAEFECDPMDGSLYIFVSRDCEKIKMLQFNVNGWCLSYCRLLEGTFRWRHSNDETLLEIEPRQLIWLLDGLDWNQEKAPKPVTAHGIL